MWWTDFIIFNKTSSENFSSEKLISEIKLFINELIKLIKKEIKILISFLK